MNNCGDCRYFQGTQFGHCRRYPESVTKQAGMWCGEHQPVKAQSEEVEPKQRKKREPKTPA